MMASLREHLEKALADLRAAEEDISRAVTSSPPKLSASGAVVIRSQLKLQREIEQCLVLLQAREAAESYLVDLEDHAHPVTHEVRYGEGTVPFHIARLLGTQSYLSVVWSIADKLAVAADGFFAPGIGKRNDANLFNTFMSQEHAAKRVPGYVWHPLRASFAWPTGIAYLIRNHFLHEGGSNVEWEFFAGNDPTAAFKIGDKAWDHLDRAHRDEKHALDPTMTRIRPDKRWPWPREDPQGHRRDSPVDLRQLLNVCVCEMDVALGIIVGTACGSVRLYTRHLLES